MCFENEEDKYDRQGEMLEACIANKSGILPFLCKSFIDCSGKTKYKKCKGPAHLT